MAQFLKVNLQVFQDFLLENCVLTLVCLVTRIFTDPSYFGQLMITTNAHIGNYGVHKNESESENMKISGLI